MGTLNERAGRVMKQVREDKKMSKADLARKMGIDSATVFRLENNLQGFTLDKIEKFCEVTKFKPTDFMRRSWFGVTL